MRLFIALSTQWRVAALQAGKVALMVRTGIDYGVLPVVAPLVPVTLSPELFGQLQLLEAYGKHELGLIARRHVTGLQ